MGMKESLVAPKGLPPPKTKMSRFLPSPEILRTPLRSVTCTRVSTTLISRRDG